MLRGTPQTPEGSIVDIIRVKVTNLLDDNSHMWFMNCGYGSNPKGDKFLNNEKALRKLFKELNYEAEDVFYACGQLVQRDTFRFSPGSLFANLSKIYEDAFLKYFLSNLNFFASLKSHPSRHDNYTPLEYIICGIIETIHKTQSESMKKTLLDFLLRVESILNRYIQLDPECKDRFVVQYGSSIESPAKLCAQSLTQSGILQSSNSLGIKSEKELDKKVEYTSPERVFKR